MRPGASDSRATSAGDPTNLSPRCLPPTRRHVQRSKCPSGFLCLNARRHRDRAPRGNTHANTYKACAPGPVYARLARLLDSFLFKNVFTDPFEPSSSSIRMRTPVFHPDGGVGVEGTKQLKQVSSRTVSSSLCPHLRARSAGNCRSGLEGCLGEVQQPRIFLRHRHTYLWVPSFLLYPTDLSWQMPGANL